VAAWTGGAYWFIASTSFANPAIISGRALSNTFASIAPSNAPAFSASRLCGALIGLEFANDCKWEAQRRIERAKATSKPETEEVLACLAFLACPIGLAVKALRCSRYAFLYSPGGRTASL
jgi:hypothetical protein